MSCAHCSHCKAAHRRRTNQDPERIFAGFAASINFPLKQLDEDRIYSGWSKHFFAIELAMRMEGIQWTVIGDIVKRDHTSVISGVRTAQQLLNQGDPEMFRLMETLTQDPRREVA